MKTKLCILLLATTLSGFSSDFFHIRYNHAGYTPDRNKSIVVLSDSSLSGMAWEISLKDTAVLQGNVGKSKTKNGNHTPFNFNYKIDFSTLKKQGKYQFKLGDQTKEINIQKDPYSIYAKSILRYLRQQRSGSHDALDHKMSHEGDSSSLLHTRVNNDNSNWIADEKGRKLNLLGGWYDAGDYLKFTLTTAYTTYVLLRAYEENPAIYQYTKYSKSGMNDMLDEIKWGLDYLEKCYVDDSTFVIQVGNEIDHQQGNRLPSMDKNKARGAYACLSKTQLAYCSASFALASSIYHEIDSSLSVRYKVMAEKLFVMAQNTELIAWYQKGHEIFYNDKSAEDNMLLAATELFKLTKDEKYKPLIHYHAVNAKAGHWLAWGDYNVHAHLRAHPYSVKSMSYFKQDMMMFQSNAGHSNNIFGVPHEYTWASLYSIISVGNACGAYGSMTNKNSYDDMLWDVADYVFGRNNWGTPMIAHKDLDQSVQNIYSQVYKLQADLYPEGAIAEGPGDKKTHDELNQWFSISREHYNRFDPFNSEKVIFYDDNSDFQCMETTIVGLADGIMLLSLISGK
ncbi:MAG: endoglucanase [Glaciecola sp.]|jgi:endoglucanase